MSEPPGRRRHHSRATPVIGAEMAAAISAEERRTPSGAAVPSPMPHGAYDPWQGHLNLYDPSELALDGALTDLVRGYRAADPHQRTSLRASIDVDDIHTLLAFARRMAVFALRRRDAGVVIDGLTACAAIDAERVDQRDVLLATALLDHAARSTDAPADALIGEVAALAGPAIRALLAGYRARPAAARRMRDAWGYVEVRAPGGPGLLPWGFRPWMPTLDVAAAGIGVAAAISRDDYQADDPILAAEMPEVWLSGAGDRALGSIIGSARGTVLVHGRLRPAVSPDHASQQLTIFVLEVSDPSAAERLDRMSRHARPDTVLLGVAAGSCFALAVARSWGREVAPFETTASLARFEPALREALARVALGYGEARSEVPGGVSGRSWARSGRACR